VTPGRSSLDSGLEGLCRVFGDVRDPRLAVLDALPESVKPSAALLATVLGQDIGVGALAKLLRELSHRLGDRLLSLGSQDWTELERACKMGFLAEWPHKDALAGWVLSVSDFLRAHGQIPSWRTGFVGPTELVEAMARELPWMGSRSPSKVKGWRLARWVVRGELGNMGWSETAREALVLPVAAVERPLRSLGWLPGGWSDLSVGKKQEWFEARTGVGFQHDPASLWVPLETVLARGRFGPACQEHLGSCKGCPVRSDCPCPGRS
jgi:hypothetical protein